MENIRYLKEPSAKHSPGPARRKESVLSRLSRGMASPSGRGYALSAPGVLYVGILIAAPLILTILYSFWTQNYLDVDRTLTVNNYQAVLNDPLYLLIILRSVAIALAVTVLTVVTAYPVAYFIAFHARRKALWLFLISIPFWISYLLRVFSWKIILGYNGVLNTSLISIGIIDQPLDFVLYNANAVVLVLAHSWAPFAILPIYVSLQKIDQSLLEVARDLGDSDLVRFLRVTLPLSMPGILGASMIILIPTVGDYVTPAMVGGSDGMMIANIIQGQFGRANNWPLGATLALISMLGIIAVALAYAAILKLITKRVR